MPRFKSRVLAVAAAGSLIFGGSIATAVTWAGPASAASGTCTNVANALVSPFGCGGLQSGTGLDLAHADNSFNGLVTVQADANTTAEDWTAFAIVPPTVIPPFPGHISGGDGFGVFVAMDTPGGILPSFTVDTAGTPDAGCLTHNAPGVTYTNTTPCAGTRFTAGPSDLCLSVEHAANVPGTNGKLRWWTVLRSCNTNGHFTYGGTFAPGTVSFFNPYQAWEPQGPQAGGFLMNNMWLFQHNNVPLVLDITGGSLLPGTAVQAYPLHNVPWEEWNVLGCTPPASLLNVAPPYVSCP